MLSIFQNWHSTCNRNVYGHFALHKHLFRTLLHKQQRWYVAVAFRHSCLTVFAWRRVVLRFSTRNNCCEFLAFYGVTTQSVIQSFLKAPVCGASLSNTQRDIFKKYSKPCSGLPKKLQIHQKLRVKNFYDFNTVFS